MLPPAAMDDHSTRRAALFASLALLSFSALTGFALIGWFYRNPAPWSWKSILASGCALGAVTASALLWRAPSRAHAMLGVLVMLLSLLRIGAPSEWTWASFALVALTFVLLMPLVHAAIVFRDND